ncbi:MAG: hypothetical protein M1816_002977 [Peltula sp. TS41687]|nr:MAG: hypothetical protein M1816_002977 [Peltula sp. TS41687]
MPKTNTSSKSFATFLILCPTTFFLGLLFAQLPYDHPILWTSTSPSAATYSSYETHLRHLHFSPPIVPRILHIVVSVGLLGFVIKLYKPSESNSLFDGASLFLYLCAVTVYVTNVVKGLRIVGAGAYGDAQSAAVADAVVGGTAGVGGGGGGGGGTAEVVVSREDSLRVVAASNTILALILVGVLGLQAGQWYAERKEDQEIEGLRRRDGAGGAHGGAHRAGGKKKQ